MSDHNDASQAGQNDNGKPVEHDCLFCRIGRGEIPSRKVYEDEHALAFHDIDPSAPVHFLIIPKRHVVNLFDGAEDPALLGHLFSLAGRLASDQGLAKGFKTQVNSGSAGGQEVYHLHIHVLGSPAGQPVRAV
ncbi:MAG: histidine triad nucleotide-binding protein [Lautropia sp.]|nr:histidine triad nucleotide-binding protein [Lautropia sp.]